MFIEREIVQKIWCLFTHINISFRFRITFTPALTIGVCYMCFLKQGIVSLSLTKVLFKEVAMTPISHPSIFWLHVWEAHWDIPMVPPLLMSSSPSSCIYIFNCIRWHRKTDDWAFVCVHAPMPLCVCHRKCSLKESTPKKKMALNDWRETVTLTIHGQAGS